MPPIHVQGSSTQLTKTSEAAAGSKAGGFISGALSTEVALFMGLSLLDLR
jgi:hypothetical protein